MEGDKREQQVRVMLRAAATTGWISGIPLGAGLVIAVVGNPYIALALILGGATLRIVVWRWTDMAGLPPVAKDRER